jgi:hypothetical protein
VMSAMNPREKANHTVQYKGNKTKIQLSREPVGRSSSLWSMKKPCDTNKTSASLRDSKWTSLRMMPKAMENGNELVLEQRALEMFCGFIDTVIVDIDARANSDNAMMNVGDNDDVHISIHHAQTSE